MKISFKYLFICITISLSMSQDAVVEVGGNNNSFTPSHIDIEVGQMVTWTRISGSHNVDGNQDTYANNPESFFSGSASSTWPSFSHTFSLTGDYDYQCNPHVTSGMVGTITVRALSLDEPDIPNNFSIYSIYPNPFNPVTNITYSLLKYTNVQISIFDLSGRQIELLVDKFQSSGDYSLDWNADNHPSGIYLVKIIADGYVSTQKLMLIK